MPRFATPHLLGLASLLLFSSALAATNESSPPVRRRVAIVCDDGPIPEQNAAWLAVLAREQVHVTFSHLGSRVVAHPELARAVAAAGHEIINHSYTHPHLKTLTAAAVAKEVGDTQQALVAATGHAPRWFWAPFLEWDGRLAAVVRSAGLEHFPQHRFHFIDTGDWNAATAEAAIRQRATTDLKDGTIILCHEWPKFTLAQMPAILAELKRQGVEFLTFSELLASDAAAAMTGKN